jgi:hypothetical protein
MTICSGSSPRINRIKIFETTSGINPIKSEYFYSARDRREFILLNIFEYFLRAKSLKALLQVFHNSDSYGTVAANNVVTEHGTGGPQLCPTPGEFLTFSYTYE